MNSEVVIVQGRYNVSNIKYTCRMQIPLDCIGSTRMYSRHIIQDIEVSSNENDGILNFRASSHLLLSSRSLTRAMPSINKNNSPKLICHIINSGEFQNSSQSFSSLCKKSITNPCFKSLPSSFVTSKTCISENLIPIAPIYIVLLLLSY